MWISRAYLRISDQCRVMVRVKVRFADCCIQTAGESDKMRINHVIKTDQWRYAPQTRPAPHFVVSLSCFMAWSQFRCAFWVTVCTLASQSHCGLVDIDDAAKQGFAAFCSGDSMCQYSAALCRRFMKINTRVWIRTFPFRKLHAPEHFPTFILNYNHIHVSSARYI